MIPFDYTEIVCAGSRGTALATVQALDELWQGRVAVRAFLDEVDNGFEHPTEHVPVISRATRLRDYADVPVLLTVTDVTVRRRLFDELTVEGATFAGTAGDPVWVHHTASFGPATFVAPWTRVGPQARVGRAVHVHASIVSHDVVIGDFSNLLFGSAVHGSVEIGSGVNVAPGAIIRNGRPNRPLRIGDGAQIGVGAVVIRDVPEGASMMGNPAMPLREWTRLTHLARGADRG